MLIYHELYVQYIGIYYIIINIAPLNVGIGKEIQFNEAGVYLVSASGRGKNDHIRVHLFIHPT